MDVFELRDRLIDRYQEYVHIRDPRIAEHVEYQIEGGLVWPEPLIQVNPRFVQGRPILDLIAEGLLHPECELIFRVKDRSRPGDPGRALRPHRHQDAIRAAHRDDHYDLTTGTGSGKGLAYERAMGLQASPDGGDLRRRPPRVIDGDAGSAAELSAATALPREACTLGLRPALPAAFHGDVDPVTGFPVFAFRLHQFIRRGDTAYTIVEPTHGRVSGA